MRSGSIAGGEPSAHGRIGQRFHTGCVHLSDPFLPHRDRSNPRGRAREDQRADTIGRVHAEPHGGQPAERQTADVCALDAGRVEDRDRIEPERVNRVRAGRGVRGTVSASIVPDDLEP